MVLAAVATAASAARRRRRRRRRQQRRRRLCKWGFDGFADGTLTDYIIQIRARPSNRPGPLAWLKCRGPSNRLSHAVTGWWSPLDDSLWCRRCGASTAATSTLWQATAGSPHGTLGHVGLWVEFQLTIAPLSLPRPGTNLTGDTALRGTNLTGAMALPGAHSPLPRPFARTRGHIHAHAYTHVELRVRRFAGFISTASTSEFYGALAKLQTLSLYQNQIGDAGLTVLASACASGALAHLRELSLGGNTISEKTKGTMRAVMSKSGGAVYL